MGKTLFLRCWCVALGVVGICAIREGWRFHHFQQHPGQTSGHVVQVHLDHEKFRYHFTAAGRAWEGTDLQGRREPRLEPGAEVEVFYSVDDPAINALVPPPLEGPVAYPVRQMIGCGFFWMFNVTIALGMLDLFLRRQGAQRAFLA